MVSDMHVRELHAGTFFSLHPHVRMYILELQGILVCYETNNCIQTYVACMPVLLYDAGFYFLKCRALVCIEILFRCCHGHV